MPVLVWFAVKSNAQLYLSNSWWRSVMLLGLSSSNSGNLMAAVTSDIILVINIEILDFRFCITVKIEHLHKSEPCQMMISVWSIFANIRIIIDGVNMWHIDQIAHVSQHVFSIFIFWCITECHYHLSMTEIDGKKNQSTICFVGVYGAFFNIYWCK